MNEKYATVEIGNHFPNVQGENWQKRLKPPASTLPETNMAPENRVSQKETSIPSIHPFLGAMLVSGRV